MTEPLLTDFPRTPRARANNVVRIEVGQELTWARFGRLGMGFGSTVSASFSTLGLGLSFGWLSCGPSEHTCQHNPTERFEQIIPPTLCIGFLQGILYRRITGTQGDETGQENAIPLLLPLKVRVPPGAHGGAGCGVATEPAVCVHASPVVQVSPRQAFQSLFAVAFGWVGLAFPAFMAIAGTDFTLYGPKVPVRLPAPGAASWPMALRRPHAELRMGWLCAIQDYNPLPLSKDWVYIIVAIWGGVLLVGMWGWVNAPRNLDLTKAVLQKSVQDQVAAVVNFAGLALSGYATGLPTLCAANSAKISGTNTWQVRLVAILFRLSRPIPPADEHRRADVLLSAMAPTCRPSSGTRTWAVPARSPGSIMRPRATPSGPSAAPTPAMASGCGSADALPGWC